MADEVEAVSFDSVSETVTVPPTAPPTAETVTAKAAENVSTTQESEASESKATSLETETVASKKSGWQKKPRYNGQQKKRKWEHFNRRDDSDEKRVRTNPEDRVKRRKYCMLMGFAGANYVGMQRNPGVNTIEEQLLVALLKNKLINDEGFSQPQMIHFQRAARTDKGVSALRQCCSLKLRKYE